MIKVFKETLIYCVQTIYTILYYVLKMDDKVIIFESNLGKNYSGNPKTIYEEMVRQGLDNEYKCIWVFNNPRTK
jgi:CDP-glycerol glycerophosphotransferase